MDNKVQERENLRNIITQWNANRLDLFEISEPNEVLEFHGVMRFYFQDAGQKVATKCIRVQNTATTRDVIQILIEKFRPDIRMLSVPEYALYEIHENGEERKLSEDEMPLLVQLNWHRDDREGRFLLRRMNEKTYLPGFESDSNNFKRKLSKREKKEKKKREKKEKLKGSEAGEKGKDSLAEKLYTELPETSFTRSISNPEAVMRRRRQQKLEKKLQQFSQEGGSEAGGTLRIFGESINQDVPYKTILLSDRDTAAHAVKEILDKYGRDKEDPALYCLVQLIVPVSNGDINSAHDLHNTTGIREYILDDDDCPLSIEKSHNKSRGVLTFHIRRRPADYQPRKRKKKPKQIKGEMEAGYTKYDEALERLPYLSETNPDGSEITRGMPKKHYLYVNVTEVGSERSSSTNHSQALQLFGPNVQARHCVIAHTEGIVTVTPSSRDAETYVNGTRIYETTILRHGMLVRFGKLHTFKFIDPLQDMRRQLSPQLMRGSVHGSLRKMNEDLPFGAPQSRGSFETTFDADGNIETTSTTSRDEKLSKKSDETNGSIPRQMTANGPIMRENSQPTNNSMNTLRKGSDPILPAILELWEEREDAFLNMIINMIDPNHVQFKLSVTYTIYMGARFRASTHFKPEITPEERAHRLTGFSNKVANMVHQVIQDHYREPSYLAFWLANASELLHFLKQDKHLSAFTFDAQDILAEGVQLAFRSLVLCQQMELQNALPAFLEDIDDTNDESVSVTTSKLLNVLSSAMSLLRRCRVNAALTIQLFSQLFHFINMWLFNKVVGCAESSINYCSRIWGLRLKKRLIQIEVWAEKQGLELAADCHLNRIVQTAHLLQSPKSNPEDISNITAKCFKLNSLQLRALFERYEHTLNETPIPRELIENVVKVAENTADELARTDGREIRLEEEPDLQLPFLLPEDGYSCDIVRGIPTGLVEFVQPLVHSSLCHLTIQPTSSGYWTIYMLSVQNSPLGGPRNSKEMSSSASEPSTEHIPQTSTSVAQPMGSLLMPHQPQQQLQPQPQPTPAKPPQQQPQLQQQIPPQSIPTISGRASAAPAFNEPELQILKLQKNNNGMGLSIVAARGVNQNRLGIYIKSVVKGGAADQDGRLTAGDQLLKVDGHSLIGITQERAAELMTQTGPIVTLEVAKQGAIYHGLAGILVQSSPSIHRGYGNPRRMSERDIPSRISHEQEMQMRAMQRNNANSQIHPRIQGSKSVPTLNEDNPINSVNGQAVLQKRRNEPSVYSVGAQHPGYNSLTSSSSVPKSVSDFNNEQHLKLANDNFRNYAPQHSVANYSSINNYSPSRPESQMSVQSQQTNRMSSSASQQLYPEERHYQNIQLYQIQQNPQMPASKPSPNSMPTVPQTHRLLHSSHSSLQTDGQPFNASQSSRPLSALISTREQEQYINPSNNTPGTPTSPRPPISPHHSMVSGQEHFLYPHNQQQYTNPQMSSRQSSQDIHDPQTLLDYPSRNYPPPHPPFIDPHSRQRDLMRQEAKMDEMREELKRREERIQSAQAMGPVIRGATPNGQWNQRPQYHPQQQMALNGNSQLRMGPPPAPKPRPMAPPPLTNYVQNSFIRHSSYREPHDNIPQEPNHPPPTVSYRYGPSGYPPSRPTDPLRSPNSNPQRTSFNDTLNSNNRVNYERNNDMRKMETHSGVVSPSPWEREEKERAFQQRLEDSKRSRDEEIKYLESLQYRTAKHEERLRKLILEKEFQRRAEEHGGEDDEDDDDDEVLDRADHRERMLSMKQDIERTRQRRIERELLMKQQNQQNMHQMRPNLEEWQKRSQTNVNVIPQNQLEEQEERLKQLRLEENRRHQELEAAQLAEERLIREAKRRQDEDLRYRGYQMQPNLSVTQTQKTHLINNQSISASNEIPPPLPKSPPPLEAPQRLDRLLLTTAPTYQQLNDISDNPINDSKSVTFDNSKYPLVVRNEDNQSESSFGSQPIVQTQNHTPKKVSWNDNPSSPLPEAENQESDLSNGPNNSFTLQDIDEVLGSNSYVSGNTPNVIGLQEVYNDPRQRIAQQKMKMNQNQRPHVGPEKLSFQEKMKMFAMEAGQQDSPKNKVKISKAQREIEGEPLENNSNSMDSLSMITTSS